MSSNLFCSMLSWCGQGQEILNNFLPTAVTESVFHLTTDIINIKKGMGE